MKKVLLLLLCLLISTSIAQAQTKSYITVRVTFNDMGKQLTLQTYGKISDSVYQLLQQKKAAFTDILNALSEEGYNVEQMNSCKDHSIYAAYMFLCSKELTDVQNTPVKEVAKYDIQGNRIDADTKGKQIVVYSDYSIKVVDSQ